MWRPRTLLPFLRGRPDCADRLGRRGNAERDAQAGAVRTLL